MIDRQTKQVHPDPNVYVEPVLANSTDDESKLSRMEAANPQEHGIEFNSQVIPVPARLENIVLNVQEIRTFILMMMEMSPLDHSSQSN